MTIIVYFFRLLHIDTRLAFRRLPDRRIFQCLWFRNIRSRFSRVRGASGYYHGECLFWHLDIARGRTQSSCEQRLCPLLGRQERCGEWRRTARHLANRPLLFRHRSGRIPHWSRRLPAARRHPRRDRPGRVRSDALPAVAVSLSDIHRPPVSGGLFVFWWINWDLSVSWGLFLTSNS